MNIRNRYEKKSIRGKDKKRAIYFFKSLVAIILSVLLAFPASLIYKDTVNAETKKARYTVLLLDVSDVENFYYMVYDNPLWAQFGLSYKGHEEVFTSDSHVDLVKEAAAQFLRCSVYSFDSNYIAIVSYTEEATVVCDFTDDVELLLSKLYEIECVPESDRCIKNGLECAENLLNGIESTNVQKNILLCTTGFTNTGDYSEEGKYNEDTTGSTWQNMESEIRLYKYANTAIAAADRIKEAGISIYVIGLFSPLETNMPNEIKEVAEFFRITARDLASTTAMCYEVDYIESLTDDLFFVFNTLSNEINGVVPVKVYVENNLPINDYQVFNQEYGYFKRDGIGGCDGISGFYEEVLWGSALFETPSTTVFNQFFTDKSKSDYDLALLSGCLAIAACKDKYIVQIYKDLGRAIDAEYNDEDNIYLFSYPDSPYNKADAKRNGKDFTHDKDLAFSIASYNMSIEGEDTDVILINACGSKQWMEFVQDRLTGKNHLFLEKYPAYDWVWEFEEDIFAGLNYYIENHPDFGKKPMKFLVCGHSLGGAAANLVAARLNSMAENKEYGDNLSIDDIYACTFGAIDSISNEKDGKIDYSMSMPVSKGYQNILNIYNSLDTFGPSGNLLFTAAGNTGIGRFGQIYRFSQDMSRIMGLTNCANHEISGYVYELTIGFKNGFPKTSGRVVMIYCPVDVDVYYQQKKICSIKSNETKTSDGRMISAVDGDTKILIFSDELEEKDIQIKINAMDSGTMSYVSRKENSENDIAVYSDIVLEKGKSFEAVVEPGSESQSLYVLDEHQNRVAIVESDGSENLLVEEPDSEEVTETSSENDSEAASETEEEKTSENDQKQEQPVVEKHYIEIVVYLFVLISISVTFQIMVVKHFRVKGRRKADKKKKGE